MKKQILFLSLIVSSIILADDLTYDSPNGWWWYTTKATDENGETKTVKVKLTTSEKLQMDHDKKMEKLLDENNKLQVAILDRLNYAYPDVAPIYSTNKTTGKRCLTNSSSDCFVMPVQAEGQQIPVLKDFLRDPSPSKSKEWLKWQATYFNHVEKVSHGLRFAYLKDGAEAYPTSTSFSLGDSLTYSMAEDAKAAREGQVIKKYKDKLAYVIFLGKDNTFEQINQIYYQFDNYSKTFMKDVNMAIVYPSEASKKNIEAYVKNTIGVKEGNKQLAKYFMSIKSSVRPDLYDAYNVQISPSVAVFFEDKKRNKHINQIIQTGTVSVNKVRESTINFLTYNEIVSEKELSADKNWGTLNPETNNVPIPEPSYDGIFEDDGGDK